MTPFVYTSSPVRVVFGPGALARLPEEIERLGARRALVLATPEQAAQAGRVAALLGDRSAGVHAGAVMHVPVEVAQAARAVARERDADCLVAVGGGSTIGLAKAIALDCGLPIVAIATTYAGSEMTPIWGLTQAGVKTTGRDPRVLARTVIYDPELTLGLPLPLTVTSGLNAIAHAAEALYAHDGNPSAGLMAEEGIRAVADALPRLKAAPDDLEARGDALYGAWLCGAVLGGVAMGLHHKLCHTLGGTFDLPHAQVHAIVLPHALAYNAAAAPQAMRRIARALGGVAAPARLHALAKDLGAPTALRAFGLRAADLDRAADLALEAGYPNPRPLERDAIRALLQRAFDGAPPA